MNLYRHHKTTFCFQIYFILFLAFWIWKKVKRRNWQQRGYISAPLEFGNENNIEELN
jgi:hypothetical protein